MNDLMLELQQEIKIKRKYIHNKKKISLLLCSVQEINKKDLNEILKNYNFEKITNNQFCETNLDKILYNTFYLIINNLITSNSQSIETTIREYEDLLETRRVFLLYNYYFNNKNINEAKEKWENILNDYIKEPEHIKNKPIKFVTIDGLKCWFDEKNKIQ